MFKKKKLHQNFIIMFSNASDILSTDFASAGVNRMLQVRWVWWKVSDGWKKEEWPREPRPNRTMQGMMRFGKKGKLSLQYVGPFEVIERIGEVAY